MKGVVWALTEKFGLTSVKLILGIVLARLLSPEDFGLIGIITVFIAIAQVFVDSGFGMAYIQKKYVNDEDADTIFISNLIISIGLYIIIFFSAPLIASFYGQADLVSLTRVLAMVILINAFNVIQRAKIVRSVRFKQLTKITFISSLLSGIIGIVAAYKGMGVWALVVQSICSRIFVGIGFWYISDYRPQWRFSYQSFKEMFSFGSWMLFSSLITTIFNNIYIIAIGKFFPVAQLGFYTKSKQLAELPTHQTAQAIGSVAFPVYSRFQDDRGKLRNAMTRFIQYSMLMIVPLITVLIIVSEPLVIILLTEKWAPIIPYFQIICFTALLYPLNQINIQSLTSLGKSKLVFNLALGRNSLRLINIFISYKLGISQMLLGEMIIAVIYFFVNTWFVQKFVHYGTSEQIRDIWKIFVGGLIAGMLAFAIVRMVDNIFLQLVSGILITGLVYLIVEYIINREVMDSVSIIVKGFMSKTQNTFEW